MNNNISPQELRRIESLLIQGYKQSDVARIVGRSRATLTTINRKMVAESKKKERPSS